MRCSVALVMLLGCSRVAPIAATSEPNKVIAKRIAGTFQLAISISREHSCSQSFERDSRITTYVLTLADDGATTLAVRERKSHVFGPSSAKFSSSGPVNKQESLAERSYAGQATATADGTRVELRETKSGGLVTLNCARAKVEIEERGVDAGRSVVEAVRCHPLPWLPSEATSHLTTAAPLADGPGLWFTSSEEPYEHSSLRRGI